MLHHYETVSYTHLDVYKRQPYKVYSFEGRFMEGGVLSNKQEINTTDWSTGLYFLILEDTDKRYKKIVFEIVR